MGDRVAVLKDGILQQCDTPRRRYEHPDNVFVAGFIGSPAMNLFDVPVVDGGVKFGATTQPVERGLLTDVGKEVTLGVRPEDLTTSMEGEGLAVTVEVVEELGADAYIYGSTTESAGDIKPIIVRVDGRTPTQAGLHRPPLPQGRPRAPVPCRDRSAHRRLIASTDQKVAVSFEDAATFCPVQGLSGVQPAGHGKQATRSCHDDQVALEITAARPDPALLDLPWSVPLEEWPTEQLAALPRGISRHVVRFVKLSGKVIAVKEIKADLAVREYNMLRLLTKIGQPCVQPLGVVNGRTAANSEELDACLLTRHLQFSLPYRVLFSQSLSSDTAHRLIDALAVLLVRLHLAGFWWGDVSLSNTLFRRDAGAFAAYLVDAETGEIRNRLSDGQREHDLDIGRVNIAGELMDLAVGGFLAGSTDPIEVSRTIVDRYRSLWRELTASERFEQGDRWRVDERIRRLNELGFDVDELAISTDLGGATIQIQPKVVDAGHHSRRLLRLTGLDVEEDQARRLLNDLDAFRASLDRQNDDEDLVAHDWLSRIYEPITRTVPRDLTRKLEPAEVFHEVLEHRWYLSESAGHDIPIEEAIADYVKHVLPEKPDEAAVLDIDPV